jgi:hypothetical protein
MQLPCTLRDEKLLNFPTVLNLMKGALDPDRRERELDPLRALSD